MAIANSRIIRFDDRSLTFKYKDYRDHGRQKIMTLVADEFIRRFLMHILPTGFHRIRHYGFLANAKRVGLLAHARQLMDIPTPESTDEVGGDDAAISPYICRSCEGPMIIIETITRSHQPRAPPSRIAA